MSGKATGSPASSTRKQEDLGERVQTMEEEENTDTPNVAARETAEASTEEMEALADLTKEELELLNYLDEVNGQDAYSNEAAAVGKLKREEFLVLPIGFVIPDISAADVGSPTVHRNFSKLELAQIYALNKAACPKDEDAEKFGFLRMEAVKIGWVSDQKEIQFKAAPADSMRIFLTDLAKAQANLEIYRTAAFIIPLAAEHTFRTMGHHYLSNEAAQYEARYAATFKACLQSDVGRLFRGSILYHTLFHWVGPARVRDVLRHPAQINRVPEAIALRASAAPAGTALVTTTAAVIKAMTASRLAGTIADEGGFDLGLITETTVEIKADPAKWHKTYYAYHLARLTEAQENRLAKAKEEAARFAPIAQAFIDAMFRDSALGRAKALRKHAEENPILKQRAERYFRKLGRREAANVADLFSTTAVD